jgi:hypothetical protein
MMIEGSCFEVIMDCSCVLDARRRSWMVAHAVTCYPRLQLWFLGRMLVSNNQATSVNLTQMSHV